MAIHLRLLCISIFGSTIWKILYSPHVSFECSGVIASRCVGWMGEFNIFVIDDTPKRVVVLDRVRLYSSHDHSLHDQPNRTCKALAPDVGIINLANPDTATP